MLRRKKKSRRGVISVLRSVSRYRHFWMFSAQTQPVGGLSSLECRHFSSLGHSNYGKSC